MQRREHRKHVVGSYPTQHVQLCFQNDCFGGRQCYVSNSNWTCAFYKNHSRLLDLFLCQPLRDSCVWMEAIARTTAFTLQWPIPILTGWMAFLSCCIATSTVSSLCLFSPSCITRFCGRWPDPRNESLGKLLSANRKYCVPISNWTCAFYKSHSGLPYSFCLLVFAFFLLFEIEI